MTYSRQHFFLQGLLALLLCCFLTSCITLPFGSKMPPASIPAVEEARKAWTANDMLRAEKLYTSLIKTAGITQDEKREAYSRCAMAQARNGNPAVGMKTLQKWLKEEPAARNMPRWQEAWFTCARAYTPSRAVSLAKEMWLDSKAPETLRLHAACILVGRSHSASQILQLAPQMGAFYMHSEKALRAALEQRLLMETRYISTSLLADVIGQTPAGRDKAFPYSILLLEQARRLAKSHPEKSAQLLACIRGAFADKSLPESVINALSQDVCVVLALPISGPVSPIARKVNAGADIALHELERQGMQIQLEVVNTESPDWLNKLSALPPQCVLVGGPLQATKLQQLKASSNLSQRAVFAFMPQLDNGDEGRIAWRFFPSPEDQIRALASLTYDDLGLRSYGAFYPEEPYGRRMTTLFKQHMAQRGASVHAVNYDPEASVTWTDAAAQLVRDVNGADSQPDAVFMPDSWKKMDNLTKSFQYYNANRMVMLGTSLWEQGLSGRFVPQAEKYALAVFPSAWNPDNAPQALSAAGKADFWKALGYDFTRFAAHMQLATMGNTTAVTARARNSQLNWSMAPIHWDEKGIAHQEMYLFTPSSRGMTLLNIDAFKLARRNVLNAPPSEPEENKEQEPQGNGSPMQVQGQPGQPGGTMPMLPGPRSSHKLQLPGVQ